MRRASTIQGHLAADGYEIVSGVLAPEELDDVLRAAGDFPRSRAGMRHLMGFDSVAKIANDRRMIGLASGAIGEGATPFRATLFDKSSDANWLVVWHQDTALPLKSRHDEAGWGPWSLKDGVHYAHAPAWALEEVVALRLHLDDSSSENGPLRVIAGTHRSGLLTDYEVEELATKCEAIECTVSKGGIIIMRPLLLHASSKSKSSAPRRILHVEYASAKLPDLGVQLAIA